MVIEDETLMYRNVVWHTYEIHYSDFDKVIDDFDNKLVAAGLTINGPLFYALHNPPLEEVMLIDMFIPVEQNDVSPQTNLRFQSYYFIDQMLMTRVTGDVEKETEASYEKLFRFIIQNDMQIVSPIYHIFRGDDELQWVDLKVKAILEAGENKRLEEEFMEKHINQADQDSSI